MALADEFDRQDARPVLLVEVALASGTRYYSIGAVRLQNQFYDGRILEASTFRRALQDNLGLFEVATLDIDIADPDTALLTLTDSEVIKGKTVTFKLGTADIAPTSYLTFHEGKIDDFGGDRGVFRILVRDRLWTLPPKPNTGSVNETDFPNALPAHKGQPLPVCYGSHSLTETDDPNDYRQRGAWPTLFVDVTSDAVGTDRVFLIACHAVKAVNEVYAFVESKGSQELTLTTDYTVSKAGTLAGQTMAYIELTSSGWTKVTDTNGRLGVITVNVDGKEDVGDGTGTLITNPIDVLEDFLQNYCENPPINSTKFTEAKNVARRRSYTVIGGYTKEKRTDEVLRDICNSFSIRMYPDQQGQVAIDIFEPSRPSDVTNVFEHFHVYRDTFSINFEANVQGSEDAQVINTVDYSYNKHYAQNTFLASDTTVNSASVTSYGTKRLVLELPWNGSAGSARDVALRYILLYKRPVANIYYRTSLAGMNYDITDQIAVYHEKGHVSGGYVDRRFEVIEHTLDPSGMFVDIKALDVAKISEDGYFLADEAALTKTSAGTAAVTNTDATVTISGGDDLTTSISVGDHLWLDDTDNGIHCVVAAPITATTFEAEDSSGTPITSWTNKSGMSFKIMTSWKTASTTIKKDYGFLCSVATGQFSDAEDGKVLL